MTDQTEFSISMPAPSSEFIADFVEVLKENKCENLFGIDTIAQEGWSEMTIGGSSVVVPSNESDSYDAEKYIAVALSFEESKPGFKVHGRCGSNHKHTSKVS